MKLPNNPVNALISGTPIDDFKISSSLCLNWANVTTSPYAIDI